MRIMKNIIHTGLLALVATVLFGCDKSTSGINTNLNSYSYYVCVSFEDAFGNDLVAPLGDEKWIDSRSLVNYWIGAINPDKYALNVIFSNPPINNNIDFISDSTDAVFGMVKFDDKYQNLSHFIEQYEGKEGKYYLYIETSTATRYFDVEIPRQNSINYQLSCPTIFGDESMHEIVTYWDDEDTIQSSFQMFPKCIRAEYDTNPLEVKKAIGYSVETRDIYYYFIDIVLDR